MIRPPARPPRRASSRWRATVAVVGLVLLACASGGEGHRPGGLADLAGREGAGHVYACELLTFSAWIGPEDAWLFLPDQTIRLPHVRSASGARYGTDRVLLWTKGEEAILEVDGVRYDGCRRDPRASVLEDAKLRGVGFRGVGQEPGWIVEIGSGDVPDRIDLRLDHGTVVRRLADVRVSATSEGTGAIYTASDATGTVRVVLEPGPCADVMSGEAYPTAVTLELGDRTLTGCGRPLH